MLLLGLTALILIGLDTCTEWLEPAKSRFEQAARPFHWLTNLPARLSEWGDENVVSRKELEAENEQLRTELSIHKAQMLRMAEITAENARLRNLLNATELLDDKVLVAELIGVSPDPLSHRILINRGSRDGAYIGQPVLDDRGLMGQIVRIWKDSSQVLLITDSSHAVPVQVLRNGVRTVAEGTGDYRRMALRYVSPTIDIVAGDVLVSSGLGGRFPVGYPVGKVLSTEQSAGQAYMSVVVEPTANIERSRHLLLVFSNVEDLSAGEDEDGG